MIRRAIKKDTITLDKMLTMLIQDERINYDKYINSKFVVNNWYKKYINDYDKLLLVYEIDGIVVGYIYGYIINEDAVYLVRHSKLDALYVLKEYRNSGIANELVNEFVKWCKMRNVKYIEVGVMVNNDIAKKIYEKNGFKKSKEIMMCEL